MKREETVENLSNGRVSPEVAPLPPLEVPKNLKAPATPGPTPTSSEQTTPRSGTKVIQRCLTDLDDLIIRRKRELNDIQKSNSYKISTTQKNKLERKSSGVISKIKLFWNCFTFFAFRKLEDRTQLEMYLAPHLAFRTSPNQSVEAYLTRQINKHYHKQLCAPIQLLEVAIM